MLTAAIFFDVSMTAAQHCAVDKGHYHIITPIDLQFAITVCGWFTGKV